MSTANITKGMRSSHMGNMCPTHTRANASRGHTNVRCPVQFVYLSIIIHRTPRYRPQPRRGTRGWRTFIPDVGPCQLTRNAPLSGGLKDDICTWHNFVTNDVSPERTLVSRGIHYEYKKELFRILNSHARIWQRRIKRNCALLSRYRHNYSAWTFDITIVTQLLV